MRIQVSTAPAVVGTSEIAVRASVPRSVVVYMAAHLGIASTRVGQGYVFHESDAARLVELLSGLRRRVMSPEAR